MRGEREHRGRGPAHEVVLLGGRHREQYPQYSKQIIAAAQQSFVDGQDWAYVAGIVAVVLGAVLVFFVFPKHDRERELLAEYEREDAVTASSGEPAA